MKPRPDCTVRLGKSQTAHFGGSFSLKNRSIGKKQGPVRTAVGPHDFENRDQTASHGSLLPLNLNLGKKKHTHTHTHLEKQKKKKHNCWESRKHGCGSRAVAPAATRRRSSDATTRLFFFSIIKSTVSPLALSLSLKVFGKEISSSVS